MFRMIHVAFVSVLVVGLGLVVLGGRLLLKPTHRERGDAKIKLKLFPPEFSSEGATGLACILLGVLCLWLTVDIAVNAGREMKTTSALALIGVAVAQGSPLQTGPQTKGWVYAPKGSFTGDDIMQAQRRAPLRANHFDDLTGTIVGKWLGYVEPDVVGQIESDDCVSVSNRTVVGFGKTWMEVKKVDCPTNTGEPVKAESGRRPK